MIILNLNEERKNTKEYLKEFYKRIPRRSSIFNKKVNIDISKIDDIKDKIEMFYERGTLISPMLISTQSITTYIDTLNAVKEFPTHLKPDVIMENNILLITQKHNNTRKILIPSIMEEVSSLVQDYDKMVAYYLAMGGDNPIERFSKVGMSMKQYGVSTDIGISIMKYGNELTRKLEELAMAKSKSPKEWECFKAQVLHGFFVAEKIGNRNVNPEEHTQWEERLIRLGILDRKLDKGEENKVPFNERVRNMANNPNSIDDNSSDSRVKTERALLENAKQIYKKTGMIPIGYKKNEQGEIVKVELKIVIDNGQDRLSASKNNNNLSKNNLSTNKQNGR